MSLKQLRASMSRARRRARHHGLLARRNRALARRRQRQIRAATTGPAAAVRWALSQVGTVEQPNGSNWGPKIADWIKACGYTGPVPWCACFATEAATHGGAARLRNGYCPAIAAGIGSYRRVPLAQARAGDFILFAFPGVGGAEPDHIGVLVARDAATVTCVEGNTSPGTAGSQNNGQGVYQRTRPTSLVHSVIRPPYPHS